MSKRNSEEVEEEEESELEEEVEEESNFIDQNRFVEFMKSPEGSFSTILEKAEIEEIPQNLESEVVDAPVKPKKEFNEIKYDSGYDVAEYETFVQKKERKIVNENLVVQRTQLVSLETIGRTHVTPEQNFVPKINPELAELRQQGEISMKDDYVVSAESLDKNKLDLPFQQKTSKYKFK